jgi:hypothetical protein
MFSLLSLSHFLSNSVSHDLGAQLFSNLITRYREGSAIDFCPMFQTIYDFLSNTLPADLLSQLHDLAGDPWAIYRSPAFRKLACTFSVDYQLFNITSWSDLPQPLVTTLASGPFIFIPSPTLKEKPPPYVSVPHINMFKDRPNAASLPTAMDRQYTVFLHVWDLYRISHNFAIGLFLTSAPVYILNSITTKRCPDGELIASCYYSRPWLERGASEGRPSGTAGDVAPVPRPELTVGLPMAFQMIIDQVKSQSERYETNKTFDPFVRLVRDMLCLPPLFVYRETGKNEKPLPVVIAFQLFPRFSIADCLNGFKFPITEESFEAVRVKYSAFSRMVYCVTKALHFLKLKPEPERASEWSRRALRFASSDDADLVNLAICVHIECHRKSEPSPLFLFGGDAAADFGALGQDGGSPRREQDYERAFPDGGTMKSVSGAALGDKFAKVVECLRGKLDGLLGQKSLARTPLFQEFQQRQSLTPFLVPQRF